MSEQARTWTVEERREDAARDIAWDAGEQSMRLRWLGSANKVSICRTNGTKRGRYPLYESPLINFDRGGEVKAAAAKRKSVEAAVKNSH